MSGTHTLKTWPEYFEDVWQGLKTFEVRRDDRLFKVGDHLLLEEWDPTEKKPTGRWVYCEVTYLCRIHPSIVNWGGEGLIGMSIKVLSRMSRDDFISLISWGFGLAWQSSAYGLALRWHEEFLADYLGECAYRKTMEGDR